MGLRFQAGYFRMVLIALSMTLISCATVPDLNVIYRLPQSSEGSKGRAVYLRMEDARTKKDFLGEGARKEFKYFSGNVSFSVTRGTEPVSKIGRFDIPPLIIEGFKTKLDNEGVQVLTRKGKGRITLVILLKTFSLDRKGRKWLVELSYEALLMRDGKMLAKQMISGQGERYEILGRELAEVLLGDIFSDSINKLDMGRLFQQAGL